MNRLALSLLTTFALSSAGAACAPTRHVTPVQTETRAEGMARVVLREIDGNIYKFTVFNLSTETMSVDRDSIQLVTAGGGRSREPGGVGHAYTIAPGGAHDVNVKFMTNDIAAGTQATITFEYALTIGGRPVPIAPLPVTLD